MKTILLTCNKVNTWLHQYKVLHTLTSMPHPCRLWWSQSHPVQVPPADLTALWLISVSSPCPAPTVPKMSPHLTHPLSLSLATQETVSPHIDDSWLFNWCSTLVWKCPICFLYKWSWVELFWQVGHISPIGMTCCFDPFKSNCECCWLWPYFFCTFG